MHALPMRLLLCLAAAIIAGAGVAADQPSTRRLRVIAGSTVVQDMVVRIGGDRVDARCLVAAGAGHGHQPVPDDARLLASADLVVINGLGFEGWFEALVKEAAFTGRVAVASRGVATLKMAGSGHDHGREAGPVDADRHDHGLVDDPHAYHDPANGVRYSENIRDALIAADPAGGDDYRALAEVYIAQVRAVDAWAKKQVARIPAASRKLVTDHDALQYFARAYGFEVRAPNSALEDSQPGAQTMAGIVAFIRQQRVKAVFFESARSPKLIRAIAAEAGVAVGDPLYLDGVPPAGSPFAGYTGMIIANVRSIVRGLQ